MGKASNLPRSQRGETHCRIQTEPWSAERAEYKMLTDTSILGNLDPEFRGVQFSNYVLQKLFEDYHFDTVADIGSGKGEHAEIFKRRGKNVTAIDYGKSVYYKQKHETSSEGIIHIVADFNTMTPEALGQFDLVWASQVLEHQPNPNFFLKKLAALCVEGGVIMVSVPRYKGSIVGGHVTIWNAGTLLYQLVHAGLDCSEARIASEGFIISLIVPKRTIQEEIPWTYDSGDVKLMSKYLPKDCNGQPFKEGFNGEIGYMNW
eukprot:CAMPEP_0118925404 /NCGR_PEP_ID=MMETSP1169-20130426/3291_1 /TAXON_ID=36882 /ORGANISM="Pyramimonas obovata, Strain CCMP722" /LENGTH=260 /DNA_ID=CAMNT_0006866695 /DNA_START=445 /DNA_END=1227 /DNA_ORIENTATION=-